MNACKNLLTAEQQTRLHTLDTWHRTLQDITLRMDCPDRYHEELLRQCDEMDRLGIIDWQQSQALRTQADEAYLHAIAGYDYL